LWSADQLQQAADGRRAPRSGVRRARPRPSLQSTSRRRYPTPVSVVM
jgi:hypothetical protein